MREPWLGYRAACGALALTAALALAPDVRAQQPKAVEADARTIAAEFGGAYEDPAIAAYVEAIGNSLVATTPLAGQKFTFTVLDSPIANAFSLPGGYVFLTRGIFALANSEAELAGVLGHEIGHIVAHHAERRLKRAALAKLAAGIAQILGARLGNPELGEVLGNVAGVSSLFYIQRYSRDQEYQADMLGTVALGKAGYDPTALATFLTALEAETRLQNSLAGRAPDDDSYSMFADHPRTPDRVRRAIAEANGIHSGAKIGRDEYLHRVDGMLFDDDPAQGVVRSGAFYHPILRLAFRIPEKWEVSNETDKVVADGSNGAGLIFDAPPKSFDGPPEAYISRVWAPKNKNSVDPFTVNGMPAATTTAQTKADDGTDVTVRLVAVRFDTTTLYRFLFIYPQQSDDQSDATFKAVVSSFRHLSDAEVARIRPYRIRIVTVRPGDTIDSLSTGMPYEELKRERFMTINGLADGDTLKPGQLVKTVRED